MSTWIDIKAEDIDLSDDKTEIYIRYDGDYMGNKYVSVKVEDIKKLISNKQEIPKQAIRLSDYDDA